MRMPKCAFAGLPLILSSLATSPVQALDIQPYDVLPAPAGTAASTTYMTFSSANTAYIDGKEVGGSLQSSSISERLTYYFDLFDHRALITGIVPYVDLRDASLGGVPLNRTDGIGDTILAGTYWVYSDTKTNRNVNITAYLGIPTGRYDPFASLSISSNRPFYALQLNGSYGLGPSWLLEGSVDVSFYGDNTNADGFGGVLKQDTGYAAQLWLSYALAPTLSLSAGWGGYWGGTQTLNGIETGFNSERQQIRGAVSWWVTPKLQLLGQINHDFGVTGGFEADSSYLLRISVLF